MSAAPTHALPSFLRDALEFASSFAATAVGVCADVTASHLCASASSSSTVTTVDYLAMVEHGMFDGYLITRVAHCASPIEKTANLLEHEFVVIEAKHEGREPEAGLGTAAASRRRHLHLHAGRRRWGCWWWSWWS